MTHPSQRPTWRKSSRSATGGDCVELADLGAAIGIRDSKNPDGPVLRMSRRALADLLTTICHT